MRCPAHRPAPWRRRRPRPLSIPAGSAARTGPATDIRAPTARVDRRAEIHARRMVSARRRMAGSSAGAGSGGGASLRRISRRAGAAKRLASARVRPGAASAAGRARGHSHSASPRRQIPGIQAHRMAARRFIAKYFQKTITAPARTPCRVFPENAACQGRQRGGSFRAILLPATSGGSEPGTPERHEKRHPSQVRRSDDFLRVRVRAQDPFDDQEHERQHLRRLPSLFHGPGEVHRHRRSRGPLQQALRQAGDRQEVADLHDGPDPSRNGSVRPVLRTATRRTGSHGNGSRLFSPGGRPRRRARAGHVRARRGRQSPIVQGTGARTPAPARPDPGGGGPATPAAAAGRNAELLATPAAIRSWPKSRARKKRNWKPPFPAPSAR